MATKIYLIFSSDDEKDAEQVEWNFATSPLADRWLTAMVCALKKPKTNREQRFLGWANRPEDQAIRVQQINESIDVINNFFNPLYEIKQRAFIGMPQDRLNELHHHFEILAGQSWKIAPWSANSPSHIVRSILWLNDLIHDYEQGDRAAKILAEGGIPARSIHCQLHPIQQNPLHLDELRSFSFVRDYGDLTHAYVQLGKTWIDALNDEDVHIHPQNITPARFFAASFCIYFDAIDQMRSDELSGKVRDFIRERALANRQEVDPYDPRHALGQITYGRLAPDSFLLKMSELDRSEFMRTHSNIYSIRIKSGAEEVTRTFAPYTFASRKVQATRIVNDNLAPG